MFKFIKFIYGNLYVLFLKYNDTTLFKSLLNSVAQNSDISFHPTSLALELFWATIKDSCNL